MNLILFFALVGLATIVIALLLKRKKERKRREQFIRETHAISQKRKWGITSFIAEIFSDREHFTDEGWQEIETLREKGAKYKADMAKAHSSFQEKLSSEAAEARKQTVFDPFETVELVEDSYSLLGRISQIKTILNLYDLHVVIVITAVGSLKPVVVSDPVFLQKTMAMFEEDIAYLEKRKEKHVPWSEAEKAKIELIFNVLKNLPFLPSTFTEVREVLLAKIKKLAS